MCLTELVPIDILYVSDFSKCLHPIRGFLKLRQYDNRHSVYTTLFSFYFVFPSDFCSSSTFNSPTASFSLLFCLDFTAQDKTAGIFLDIFMCSFILISFFYDIGDICVLYIVWDATVGILSAVRHYKLGRHYNIPTVEDIKFKLMSAFSASLKV